MRELLGPIARAAEDGVAALAADAAVERIWARDHTLWRDDPTEIGDRLGWLEAPAEMLDRAGALESFGVGLTGSGMTDAVVMGMGGSSLFPEVVASTFGDGERALRLHVLDTTDPAAVTRLAEALPLDDTLFIAASKSGATLETTSQLAYFWDLIGAPDRFAVITDPGTALAQQARERGFRAVFENRPDVGGRFSALTHFGLVPAALVGVDVEELLQRALDMADACRKAEHENPGIRLGAALAAAVGAGRDKLTLRCDPSVAAFGAWLEQLLAESTGKSGIGIIPVDGEPPREPGAYGADRAFALVEDGGGAALAEAGHPVVEFDCADPYDLGAEVLRWEFATAVAGAQLGVNPFDQPDVQAAKDATNEALGGGAEPPGFSDAGALLRGLGPGDYLAVQAYVDPGSPTATALREATHALGAASEVAATFGLGPRYLHSTGQVHKGGPPSGVFVQVVGDDPVDVPVPGTELTFSRIKRAQADGDLAALLGLGRRAGRVRLDDLLEAADAT